ncbi:MAG: ABC transporter permease [Verrucomicrobiales bacterium]|nr:ABC transporter permease [Verrucomicrobiales bacterium]
MTFLTVAWKNLLRRPTRTLLTLGGIGVGIAAVVALTGLARGFERVWQNAYEARGTDLVIAKTTSRSPVPTPFDAKLGAAFASMPEVESSAGLLSDLMGVEDSPTMLVFGWDYPSFLWDHLALKEGEWPRAGVPRQLVLGSLAARTLGKKVGDTVQIEFDAFRVAGIFESPALVENGAVIMPLSEMQRVTERSGQVNFLNFRLRSKDRASAIESVRRRLEAEHRGFHALEAGEVASRNTGVEVARGMSWATSVIALAVGAFGVANTVLMSVFERTRELGILLAIGWKRRRVLAMVLIESVVLSLVGGVFGSLVGVAAIRVLERTELLRGKLEADLGPGLFGMALLVALGLGVAGGWYPAWRASRLEPGEALRAE